MQWRLLQGKGEPAALGRVFGGDTLALKHFHVVSNVKKKLFGSTLVLVQPLSADATAKTRPRAAGSPLPRTDEHAYS